jgi:hypothetical protein
VLGFELSGQLADAVVVVNVQSSRFDADAVGGEALAAARPFSASREPSTVVNPCRAS